MGADGGGEHIDSDVILEESVYSKWDPRLPSSFLPVSYGTTCVYVVSVLSVYIMVIFGFVFLPWERDMFYVTFKLNVLYGIRHTITPRDLWKFQVLDLPVQMTESKFICCLSKFFPWSVYPSTLLYTVKSFHYPCYPTHPHPPCPHLCPLLSSNKSLSHFYIF